MSDAPHAGVLKLSAGLVNRGRSLLDQQIWCWGQDVVRPANNLLVEYGLERLRPPASLGGVTCYAATHRSGFSIALWSWGLFFGDAGRGGVLVRRYSFAPQVTPTGRLPAPHWPEGRLPEHRPPATADEAAVAAELFARACRWIAHYESWIATTAGTAYRADCLRDWPRSTGSADRLAELWDGLAAEIVDEACRVASPRVALGTPRIDADVSGNSPS